MEHRATPVLVKACLNGSRSRAEHGAVPLSPEELAVASRDAVLAGASALHVHPRDDAGHEVLDPDVCAEVVTTIRTRCPGVPLGLSNGPWVDPDPKRRLLLLRSWRVWPDFVYVGVPEDDWHLFAETLLGMGVGVEAGIGSPRDAEVLLGSGLADRCLRVLVGVREEDGDEAAESAAEIAGVLDEAAIAIPQLHHGNDRATWSVVEAALMTGRDVCIGFEDTLWLPDGRMAATNGELVAEVVRMAVALGRVPSGPAVPGATYSPGGSISPNHPGFHG